MDAWDIASLLAGGIISFAAIPKIAAKIKNGAQIKFNLGDWTRDLMIVSGNVIWVLFGIHKSIPAIYIFCGINSILTSILVIQNLNAALRFLRPSKLA